MIESAELERIEVATAGTHHILNGGALYSERFDAVLNFHPPGLAAVERDGAAWHIDVQGRAAYEARFEKTFGFYEGHAAVVEGDDWHHVLPDGTAVSSSRYDWCGNYQQGRCSVRGRDSRYFHLGPDGRPAYQQRWCYAGDFREGTAVIQSEEGRSTHIGPDGAFVHGRWFFDLDVFHKRLARARCERGWMHIDRSGLPIYERRFAMVEPFYNGQARVERFDGGLEVIAPTGATIFALRSPR